MNRRACYLLTWYFLSFSWPLDDLWRLPKAGYVYTTSGIRSMRAHFAAKPAPASNLNTDAKLEPNKSLQTPGVTREEVR